LTLSWFSSFIICCSIVRTSRTTFSFFSSCFRFIGATPFIRTFFCSFFFSFKRFQRIFLDNVCIFLFLYHQFLSQLFEAQRFLIFLVDLIKFFDLVNCEFLPNQTTFHIRKPHFFSDNIDFHTSCVSFFCFTNSFHRRKVFQSI